MRYGATAVAIAAVMVAGCATTQRSYQTSATVYPAEQAGQYTVEFKILETGEGGKQDILSAPKITVLAGQEGQIKVYDEKEGNGIFCTVLVTETASGLETLTTVTVKAEGKESLNTSQKTIIKK